jgi:predicted metal-dependent peptidase
VDAEVHDDLTTEDALEVAKALKGGGGSDYCPAFRKLEEEYYSGCVVAITDGCIGVPETQPRYLKGVLWVTQSCENPPTTTWGEHVKIPADAPATARR